MLNTREDVTLELTQAAAESSQDPQILELQRRIRRYKGSDAAVPAQAVLELDAVPDHARGRAPRSNVPAVMEHNLSRKGVWAAEPDRRRLTGLQETTDLVGTLKVETALGQLSTFEMELVAWILGRADQTRTPVISFSYRECTREFEAQWSGQRGQFLRAALKRIASTKISGTVYDARTKRRMERDFTIFDLQIEDRAESLEGPSLGPVIVTVILSKFIFDQLEAGQLSELDWGTLRRKLKTPLSKRLYVLLQGQRGFPTNGDSVIYEETIDPALMATLGCRDVNPRRFRAKLLKAGEEIVSADHRYREVTVRPGKGRGVYVLSARRAA